MNGKRSTPKDIDEYIARCPADVQPILQRIRQTIHKAAPEAVEAISYQIPTFRLNGNLVHFAAFKDHISFFPTASGREHFGPELSKYKGEKGTVQFPLDEPIPYALIGKITRFRAKENVERAAAKAKRKQK